MTDATSMTGRSGPVNTADVRDAVRSHLLTLNFHAFARCVALLLERMGYEDVRLAGRTDFKGRNRHGGYDLEATAPSAFMAASARRVIVALKQFDSQMVFQKSIDELRGTCLRVGAHEALLITTGSFAPSVEQWYGTRPEPLLAPVRLIDGKMLLDWLIQYRIGIWEEPADSPTVPPRYGVDSVFFADLSRVHEGNGPADCQGKAMPPIRVTVQVERVGDRRHKAGQLILDGWEQ